MIFDIAFALILIGSIKMGYSHGFLRTILSMVGYVVGAVAGLYFALQYNQSAWVIAAIFLGAWIGSTIGSLIAKALKVTVLVGPLGWINSIAGALLEAAKVVIVAFLIGTALLWAPWSAGQNAMADSKVYLQMSTYMPDFLSSTFSTITSRFEDQF